MTGHTAADTDIAIVGAGFGGLGTAIRLKQEGIEDFVVLERGAEIGGTWFANGYPGCQCDVPSNLYSFSFAPKADWSHSYPQQPEILDYLRDCARRFGIDEHIRLNCELLDATWSASDQRWTLETGHGELRARVLIAAPGLLSEPTLPRIPGLLGFRGRVFHSAEWDHGHEFSGERVALLGTGATAVQIATVAGFPNLFLLYGPNLNLGHSSIVYMLEAQIHYVLEALRAMRASGAGTVEVRAEAQERWNAALQERLRRTVWNRGGCSSWYVDANGRNSVMWPGFTFRYRQRVNRFDPGDYILEREPAEIPADALVVT